MPKFSFPSCLVEFKPNLLAVGLERTIQIHNLALDSYAIKVPLTIIKTDIMFQFLVSPTLDSMNIDSDFLQDTYIGYSYGSYYECGLAISKDQIATKADQQED